MPEIINYLEQPAGWNAGKYELESYEQYASIRALRSSELKQLKRSPAHYRAAIMNPKPKTSMQEKVLAKGKAFDVLVLHGIDAFEALVTVEPDLNRNSKLYKEWRKVHRHCECILTKDEKNNILSMVEAARQKKRFVDIFDGPGIPHRVIVWQDQITGIWCKAEIDWICADGTVVDLKSTADAGFWFFSRNAYRLGYFNQGAFYLAGLTELTGITHQDFMLSAIEVDPPFESHVFRVSEEQIRNATVQNENAMEKLKWCLENDLWPGYEDLILDIDSGHYFYEDDFDDYMEDNVNGF